MAISEGKPTCKCPEQTPPPGPPRHMPCAPSTANIPEMKAWLLERYAASTFNKYTHQPLPQMDRPPMEIHLVDDATPCKVSTPAISTHSTSSARVEVCHRSVEQLSQRAALQGRPPPHHLHHTLGPLQILEGPARLCGSRRRVQQAL